MANENTATLHTNLVKAYYSRKLLEYAMPKLVHAQFAQPGVNMEGQPALPQNAGDTIYFTKFSALSNISSVLPNEYDDPTPQLMSTSQVSCQVQEYGGLVVATKKLALTSFTAIPPAMMKLVADQAAKSIDALIASVMNAGSNVVYANGKAARTELSYSDTLTPALVKRAARFLETKDAPTFADGTYVGIVHPSAKHDLTNHSEWTDVMKYSSPERQYTNEIGRLYNVRFVESTAAKVFADSGSSGGTSSGAPSGEVADVYSTLIFGSDFYGIVPLAGLEFRAGQDPANLLGRKYFAGWYILFNSLILQQDFGVRLESGATLYSEDL